MARLLEPALAKAVARRVAGDRGLTSSYLLERLQRDLEAAVPEAEALVAEHAGITPPPPVAWRLIDRAAWAEANISGMAELLAPLTERVGARLERLPLPVRLAQRGFVSVEVGVLLGYVSRRVLGQYDLLVPEAADGKGAPLYFVGPNLVETERRLGLVPRDFTLWVALHEITHRFQFAGVPWLRPRFFALIEGYLKTLDLDARGLALRLAGAARRLASRATPAAERTPVYLFASDEQRAMLDEMQAFMAVVEGHGNYVMDAAGADAIPTFARMRALFQARRAQANALQRAVNGVIGLELKLRQYELGQAFCERVAARAGPGTLGALWAAPEHLPSLQELEEPERWLSRVA
jgi:coenzyme F420 biosynthesis associated uncharacterized protein